MNLADRTCVLMLALVAVILVAVPSFAGKEAISDQDLDRVSAAGTCQGGSAACDPTDEDSSTAQNSTITQGTSGRQITNTAINILTITQAQQGMRATVLNNLVGTNQVANGINVFGGGPR